MLTDALGLDRAYVVSMQGALPATRFAVEAYVDFVRERTLLEAVASSLTELFAPSIHRERISGMLESYDFIGEKAMQYFRRRLDQANRDADFALDYVKRHATTPEEQAAAVDAVRFKCNVLWAQLDALHHAYVTPGADPARRLPSGGRMSDAQGKATIIGPASQPALPRQIKMRHDAARDRWTILAPERVFTPDAIAVAVLQLCDGVRSVEVIAAELAKTYNAPKERILADITALLQELADKGVVSA